MHSLQPHVVCASWGLVFYFFNSYIYCLPELLSLLSSFRVADTVASSTAPQSSDAYALLKRLCTLIMDLGTCLVLPMWVSTLWWMSCLWLSTLQGVTGIWRESVVLYLCFFAFWLKKRLQLVWIELYANTLVRLRYLIIFLVVNSQMRVGRKCVHKISKWCRKTWNCPFLQQCFRMDAYTSTLIKALKIVFSLSKRLSIYTCQSSFKSVWNGFSLWVLLGRSSHAHTTRYSPMICGDCRCFCFMSALRWLSSTRYKCSTYAHRCV